MRINFRQGIVSHQTGGFLAVNGSGHVDLLANDRSLTVTVADKASNYTHSEDTNVTSAFLGPFAPGIDYWLFVKLDTLDFARTFEQTTVAPIAQPTQPMSPTSGQLWFNTTTSEQFQYNGTSFIKVQVVVLARLRDSVLHSVSQNTPLFTGTQIGNNNSVLSGQVLFTDTGTPIRKDNGTFFTTEDQFFAAQSKVTAVRLESNITRAKSNQTAIAEYSIVAFNGDSLIGVAQYNDTGTTVLAVLTEELLLDQVGSVVTQGTIINPLWDFSAVAVGSPLWVENGILVSVDPHTRDVLTYPKQQQPVARVLGRDTILFEQGLGGVGPRGPTGSIENLPIATDLELGAVALSVPSLTPFQPIVVGTNDPRLVGAPFAPFAHTHTAGDITNVPAGSILSINLQGTVNELDANITAVDLAKLNLTGGTLTGDLILNQDPTQNLQAVTKQYVDTADLTKLNLTGGTLTGDLILNQDPTVDLQAATKKYVDDNAGGGGGSGNILGYTSTAFGTTTSTGITLTAGSVDQGVQHIVDTKANSQPLYVSFSDLPNPNTVPGMVAEVTDDGIYYIARAGEWIGLSVNDGTFQGHNHVFSEDIVISNVPGFPAVITTPEIFFSYVASRPIRFEAPDIYGFALDPADNGNITILVILNDNILTTFSFFQFEQYLEGLSAGQPHTLPSFNMFPGDALTFVFDDTQGTDFAGVSLTLQGCRDLGDCPVPFNYPDTITTQLVVQPLAGRGIVSYNPMNQFSNTTDVLITPTEYNSSSAPHDLTIFGDALIEQFFYDPFNKFSEEQALFVGHSGTPDVYFYDTNDSEYKLQSNYLATNPLSGFTEDIAISDTGGEVYVVTAHRSELVIYAVDGGTVHFPTVSSVNTAKAVAVEPFSNLIAFGFTNTGLGTRTISFYDGSVPTFPSVVGPALVDIPTTHTVGMAFDVDGNFFAAVGAYGLVLYDLSDWSIIPVTFQSAFLGAQSVAFSQDTPSGIPYLVIGHSTTIGSRWYTLVDLNTFEEVRFNTSEVSNSTSGNFAIDISPDGVYIVVGNGVAPYVYAFELATGNRAPDLVVNAQGAPLAITMGFEPEGKF